MSKPLPRIPGNKPKAPQHDLDRLIVALQEARPTYEAILQASADWHAIIKDRRQVKTSAKGKGIPLRNFTPIDPLGEWLDISSTPARHITALEKQGLIACLQFEGKWMARPGVAR